MFDRGLSGTIDERAELQRFMRDVQASRCDIVAVWKLDRFFRKLGLLLKYKGMLDRLGVAFVSISDGVNTANAMGRLVFNILGSPATRRGLLDKHQAELRAYPSHVDINALIPVTPIRYVTPEDAHWEDDTEYLQGCKPVCRNANYAWHYHT